MPTPRERAQALHAALRSRTPIPPLTATEPGLTAVDGYLTQQELVAMLLAEGDAVVGWKLGLTSKPMQEMLGIDQPDYAPQLRSQVIDDGASIPVSDYIQPKVEAEIALVLGSSLRGPGVSLLDAARAVEGAVAAIELVDSRIEDWEIGLPDTIADLASAGSTILGSRVIPLDFDLRLTGMVIWRNGEIAATGAGAAALGNPVSTVAWLANTLAPYEITLEAGMFVMTGALHAAFDVRPGDVIRADFDRLGPVRARFV
jgi:2-keto-4-pentenoate hydratase